MVPLEESKLRAKLDTILNRRMQYRKTQVLRRPPNRYITPLQYPIRFPKAMMNLPELPRSSTVPRCVITTPCVIGKMDSEGIALIVPASAHTQRTNLFLPISFYHSSKKYAHAATLGVPFRQRRSINADNESLRFSDELSHTVRRESPTPASPPSAATNNETLWSDR